MYESQPAHHQSSQWWRWIIMPFASIVGAIVAALLMYGLQWFAMKYRGGFSEDGWYFIYVLPIFIAGAAGYAYAYIACCVAPTGKVIAGVIMTSILGVITFLAIIRNWMTPEIALGEAIQMTIGNIVTLIAAVGAILQVRDEIS